MEAEYRVDDMENLQKEYKDRRLSKAINHAHKPDNAIRSTKELAGWDLQELYYLQKLYPYYQ